MITPCFEIVTYTVGNSEGADRARRKAQELLSAFPGFIAWTAFSGTENSTKRADLVVWQSPEEAQSAAEAVSIDPAFDDFRASITGVTQHGTLFDPRRAVPSPIQIEKGGHVRPP